MITKFKVGDFVKAKTSKQPLIAEIININNEYDGIRLKLLCNYDHFQKGHEWQLSPRNVSGDYEKIINKEFLNDNKHLLEISNIINI